MKAPKTPIIAITLDLMIYRPVIELADPELKASIIANPAYFQGVRAKLAADIQTVSRLKADANSYETKASPVYNRLCKFMEEVEV